MSSGEDESSLDRKKSVESTEAEPEMISSFGRGLRQKLQNMIIQAKLKKHEEQQRKQ
jgi:hypothetical protein